MKKYHNQENTKKQSLKKPLGLRLENLIKFTLLYTDIQIPLRQKAKTVAGKFRA